MALSTIFWASLAFTAIYISTTLTSRLKNRRSNLKFAREHGCLPLKVRLPALSFPFSLIPLIRVVKAIKEKRYIDYLHDQVLEYGTTRAYTSPLAEIDVVITCDPENIKAVLSTSFHDFSLGELRHEAFSDLLGDGIFTTDGKVWEHARALLRPQFSKDQIADLEDLEIHFQNLFAVLSSREGEVVGLHKLFLSFTLDSATSFLFGQSVYSLRKRIPGIGGVIGSDRVEDRDLEEDFDYSQDALGFRLGIWPYRFFYRPRRLPKSIAKTHKYVDELVNRAIRRSQDEKIVKEGKYVFLEALARDTQDPKVLRDQSLSALLAGRDTTATLLTWVFFLLSRDQRVWGKLRQEILNKVGQELPTYQQLKDLQYLKCVINETLRVFPIIPLNFRYCNKNTTLPVGGGPDGRSPVFVEKGSRVVYIVYSLHRDKGIYGEDADKFRPERWSEGPPRGWEFLPFNGGPRICIGQQMALVTASYVIVRLLQMFERIEDADPDPSEVVRTNLTLTLSPANGTPVRLYKGANGQK